MTSDTPTNEHDERVELIARRNGVVHIDRGFRWDGEKQHHVPLLTIEFEPVPANGPVDSKGWADRDAVAAMLEANALRGSVSKNRMKQLSAALGNPITVEAMEGDSVEDALIELATARLAADAQRPIDMVLYCPKCGMQRIDQKSVTQTSQTL